MNRMIACLILAALGMPLAALAQSTPTPVEPPAPADSSPLEATTAPDDANEIARADENQGKEKPVHPYCLRDTGSLIRQTGGRQRCAGIGSAYSREDLQRTGATDIGDALRRLDSSIH